MKSKIKTLSLITVAVVFFFFYFSATTAKDRAVTINDLPHRNSVTMIKGKYKIDSSVIRQNINKNRLVNLLKTEVLAAKFNIAEIPTFVHAFLDSISFDGSFDIVNPGEEWKSGITDYGHQVITKVYDAVKKDTVLVLSGDGAILPDKQLVYFGISDNIALLSYFRGGFGALQNIIILKFEKKTIVDFWYGAVFNADISTKKDILKALTVPRKNDGC